MTQEELEQRAAEIQWFHTIDLGQGLITAGVDDTPRKLQSLGLPDDLHGRTVLDIGAWDGFFSFEAERRGAARVLAVDSYSWTGSGWGNQDGFRLAREALNSQVEDRELEVSDISPESVGTFDLVLFLGVLYHMPYPLQALERVAAVTEKHLILETAVDFLGTSRPAMAFFAGTEFNEDPTNWWAPNPPALRDMLATVGFRESRIVRHPTSWPRRFVRAARRAVLGKPSAFAALSSDRIVMHAWK